MAAFEAADEQPAGKRGQEHRATGRPRVKPAGGGRVGARHALTILTGGLGLFWGAPGVAASGQLADTVATYLAVFIIVVVPIAFVALFWLVHVLPEKIAEKRHHPQKDAIHVLCLLSLVFGGLLWPLAWLWAYTRPVLHQLAYGRDRHDDYYDELPDGDGNEQPVPGLHENLARMRRDLVALESRGASPEMIRSIDDQLNQLEDQLASGNPTGGAG